MPRYIKPISIPVPVAPIGDEFRLSRTHAGELALFDHVAQEHARIGGTDIEFYHQDQVASTVDPLYGEATNHVWRGPWKLVGNLEWPDSMPEMREEGVRFTIMCRAWIARKEFEDAKCPFPEEGDIIRVWNIPYFNKQSVNGAEIPNAGYFFSVADTDDDGHIFDNPDFVGFVLDLRRNNEFNPERRLIVAP